MNSIRKILSTLSIGTGAVALLLTAGQVSFAQSSGQSQPPAPAAQQPDKSKPSDPAGQPMDKPQAQTAAPAAAAANPEEEAAFKAIGDTPPADHEKKIKLGEEFLQKYPQSRYRPAVYQTLVSGYFATQQVPKLLDAADKDIALNPADAPVMAVVAQTIARTFNPKAPDAEQQLVKAESYSKKAIEIVPTLPKPANLTDDAFLAAKNDTLVMAHSGLGLVYIREGKFAESIPELEQAVKSDVPTHPDPVNYYLLGLANDKTSHFDAAGAAYTKCAAQQSSLQATCKAGADEAKKKGSTQLSAPN